MGNRAFLDPVDQVVAETAFAVVGMYDPEGHKRLGTFACDRCVGDDLGVR
jgi:hypothetical protein